MGVYPQKNMIVELKGTTHLDKPDRAEPCDDPICQQPNDCKVHLAEE
jgi:hypothetical protein